MTAGKDHYKQNIYENVHTRFFVATNAAMMEYPWMVGRYDESSPTLASKAEEYILDSAIGDESVGNEDVLDRADDIGTDIVVCADVMHDTTQTTDRIAEMLKLVEQRDTDYEVLIPLQFDPEMGLSHIDHYEAVADRLDSLGEGIDDYRLYVGGLIKGVTPANQIRRCIELREHVGTEPYLHGLGVGATRSWVVTMRACPWLLDSFDNSSIVQNLIYSGKLWTPHADWFDGMDLPRGTNSTVLAVQFVEASLDLFNYMIGTDIRAEDAVTEFENPNSELAQRVSAHQRWYGTTDKSESVVVVDAD